MCNKNIKNLIISFNFIMSIQLHEKTILPIILLLFYLRYEEQKHSFYQGPLVFLYIYIDSSSCQFVHVVKHIAC